MEHRAIQYILDATPLLPSLAAAQEAWEQCRVETWRQWLEPDFPFLPFGAVAHDDLVERPPAEALRSLEDFRRRKPRTFQVRRILDATAALAKADRAAADEILDGPEPLQSAETLAALAYQQALALRQFPDRDDKSIVGALSDAVEDGDAIRAQVLCDLADGIRWSIERMELMDQVGRLKKQAIALRADPARAAALAALALLDGDRETAGIDGKVEAIGYAVGRGPTPSCRRAATTRWPAPSGSSGRRRRRWAVAPRWTTPAPCAAPRRRAAAHALMLPVLPVTVPLVAARTVPVDHVVGWCAIADPGRAAPAHHPGAVGPVPGDRRSAR